MWNRSCLARVFYVLRGAGAMQTGKNQQDEAGLARILLSTVL
jgi:hypothetical protein